MADSQPYKWDPRAAGPSYPTDPPRPPYGDTYRHDYPPVSQTSTPVSEYSTMSQPMPYNSRMPGSAYSPVHRSRSGSIEQSAFPAPPSTYVLPSSSRTVSTTFSPTSLYEHQVWHNSPEAGRPGDQPSASSARGAPREDRPALPSMRHRPGMPTRMATSPALPPPPSSLGLVGSADGWSAGAPAANSPPPVASSSRKKTGSASSAQGPRKRVPASCTPCRKKKLRCNRAMPCASDAVPLFIPGEDKEVKDLKAQVDRLQHLLDTLTQSNPFVPSSARTVYDVAPRPSLPPVSITRELSTPMAPKFDLQAQDLAGALAELALTGMLPPLRSGYDSFAPGGLSGEAFVEDAKRHLASLSHHSDNATDAFCGLTPLSGAPTPPSPTLPHSNTTMSSAASTRPSASLGLSIAMLNLRPVMAQVVELIPSHAELDASYKFYISSVHWHLCPINPSSFEKRWSTFSAALATPDTAKRERELDPLFVAVLLGACASGLASMSNKQAKARGFSENRSAIVERWVHVAMLALAAGKFLEEPSLDGVRASIILASLHTEQSMSVGETSSGLALLSLAVNSAFALELHRDPVQRGKPLFPFAVCEERRRLFWCLFSLCMSITSFDLGQVDCKFPLDCYDEELEMDERATKARTDKVFGCSPCTYSDVLSLDSELYAYERTFPLAYELPIDAAGRVHFGVPPSPTEMRSALIQLCLSAEFVRLHRPFLVLAATDERYQHSREQCVNHHIKVISAAVAVALELLQSPTEADAPIIRNLVDATLRQAEDYNTASSICRRGTGVVRFLLRKIDEEIVAPDAPRRAKRPRTLTYDPLGSRSRQPSLAHVLGGAPMSAPPTRAPSPEYNLRRKAVRPPLVHVASDTVVPRVTATATRSSAQAPALRSTRSRSADQALPTMATLLNGEPAAAHVQNAPVSEPDYSVYTIAPQGRQIAGLGSASGRHARGSTGSSNSAGYAPDALTAFSSPDMSINLPLPNPYMASAPLSSTSTTGGFDFSGLSLATGGPLSSASMHDESHNHSFFDLPATSFEASAASHSEPIGGAHNVDEGAASSGGLSKFNMPLDDDFHYLQQYQS
ncbi:hypothetical protein Rhopal_005838-T1 [Rhodotorula paludigena]|uniref:Transcription factor domain-containing protein n=1 Tax=Rhodotorula paludigena TaxID=86838 RepID=A0AAV5GSB7_9BASI|nr:hypothetical protein Rhopal_005838-T1 [Rhodotorula paludigena]